MASREDWIGRTGLEWSRRGSALETLLGPAGQEGLRALAAKPGERILDLGCGAGPSSVALANAVATEGHVLAIDVSPDLVVQAREKLAGHQNVEVIEADAETQAFEPESFDALFSRFGSMFFDNPEAAFSNLGGAMKPGARAVFVAWREAVRNQWASVPMTFTTDGAAPQGPQAGPGPFAWADPGVFRPALEAGGFQDIAAEPFEFMAEVGDGTSSDPVERAAEFMFRIGPLAARLKGASDEAKEEARAFLQRRLARHVQDGAVRLLASAWIITARV
ncbi:MAG: class I SAM-dependent methyltransferase [Pseudomonadota bacterium]